MFRSKLRERLDHPRVRKDALHFMPHHYKIKLRDKGYRLIYSVNDETVMVMVVIHRPSRRNLRPRLATGAG